MSLILTCVIRVAGALLGGDWFFRVHALRGFFNLSTWLTVIVGAAVLLLAGRLVTRRPASGPSRPRRRPGWAQR